MVRSAVGSRLHLAVMASGVLAVAGCAPEPEVLPRIEVRLTAADGNEQFASSADSPSAGSPASFLITLEQHYRFTVTVRDSVEAKFTRICLPQYVGVSITDTAPPPRFDVVEPNYMAPTKCKTFYPDDLPSKDSGPETFVVSGNLEVGDRFIGPSFLGFNAYTSDPEGRPNYVWGTDFGVALDLKSAADPP